MGVNLFRDDAPHEFGVFTLGLYSMFRLTGGETQVRLPEPAVVSGMMAAGSAAICGKKWWAFMWDKTVLDTSKSWCTSYP